MKYPPMYRVSTKGVKGIVIFLSNFVCLVFYRLSWLSTEKYKICDILKTAPLRAKRSKIWAGRGGGVFSANRVLLTVKCSRSVWGHSVHLRFLATFISKMVGCRAKWTENSGLGDISDIYAYGRYLTL